MPISLRRTFIQLVSNSARNRVSPRAGVQFSTAFPRQLAADGESSAGVRDRHGRDVTVAADVRSDGLQGATSTTNGVHRRLCFQQRMVNT